MTDLPEISRLDLPYKNLVLTGYLGVGKSTVGRAIARHLGADILDIDEEIQVQEVMSIAKIRELYGDARLKGLERELCSQAALMRRAVIVVSGAAMLNERNFSILNDTGQVVVLTCELGEALRRLHLSSPKLYLDKNIRGRMMSRLRREIDIVENPDLLHLDTTHMSIEEESALLLTLWATGQKNDDRFHIGPPPAFRPPMKAPVGLSSKPHRPMRKKVVKRKR